MPANVTQAFERGVSALFGVSPAVPPLSAPPANVFAAWNRLASKFPEIYPFATVTHKARETEEKLCALYKLDPRTNAGRMTLAALFAKRLENESAGSVEAALEKWWKEVSAG